MSKNKNEVTKYLGRYLHKRKFAVEDRDKESWNLISNILVESVDFDNPDGYAVLEDGIYLIEHFQFDASKQKRKGGSMLEMDLSKADKGQQDTYTVISPKSNVSQYMQNLIANFEAHANKYEKYKDNTRSHLGTVKDIKGLVFLIEDATIFGVTEVIDEDLMPFEFVLTSEFMDVWKKYEFVKYIVTAGRNQNDDWCAIYSDNCKFGIYASVDDKTTYVLNKALHRTYEIKIPKEIING